jgi:peptidoglycan/LPS O-acetylase OafA/YrhL
MMVVLSHCALAFQPGLLSGKPAQAYFSAGIWISSTPLTFFWNPELGVAIFFVLSGFVLANSVKASHAPLSELALRRYIRLSGPILGTSLLIWGVVASGLLFNKAMASLNGSEWLAMNFAWTAYEKNDLGLLVWQSLIDIYARSRHWWNFALWTMPIEFWGSLGLFCCYAGLRRFAAPPAARLIAAVAIFLVIWRSAYSGFAAGAALFEVTCLLGGKAANRARGWICGAGLLAAGFVLGGTPWNLLGTPYWPGFVWLSERINEPVLMVHRFGAICIVAAALVFPPLRALLAKAPFQFLGRVSFMIYLLHIVLICSLFSWLMLRLSPTLGYNGATVVGLVIFLVVLLGAAAVATTLIDRPSIRLARRVGAAGPRAVRSLTMTVWSRLAAARVR